MFPQVDIVRWRAVAPWADDDDVEQDLVITLALFDIFRDESLKQALAFRGGTALHKLHLPPAARYSEDVDLVQREPGPSGPTLDGCAGCSSGSAHRSPPRAPRRRHAIRRPSGRSRSLTPRPATFSQRQRAENSEFGPDPRPASSTRVAAPGMTSAWWRDGLCLAVRLDPRRPGGAAGNHHLTGHVLNERVRTHPPLRHSSFTDGDLSPLAPTSSRDEPTPDPCGPAFLLSRR